MKIRFNLLPETQKKHLRTQKNLRTIMEQEIYFLIVFGVLLLSLFAMYFLLKTETAIMKEVEQEMIARSGYSEVLQIHDQFRGVHTKMDRVNALEKKSVKWSNFFILLSENIDMSIRVNTLQVAGGHVSITATADTRDDVVELKEKIGSVRRNDVLCFENVTVPEAQLAVPVNVTFSIGFDVSVSCLE